jgi:hypothetical protein
MHVPSQKWDAASHPTLDEGPKRVNFTLCVIFSSYPFFRVPAGSGHDP